MYSDINLFSIMNLNICHSRQHIGNGSTKVGGLEGRNHISWEFEALRLV